MNLWLVLPGIVLLGLLYVLFPVGAAMATRFRRASCVRCPATGDVAMVRVSRAGVAEALARPSLRRVAACSEWPQRAACGRECLSLVDLAPRAPVTAG